MKKYTSTFMRVRNIPIRKLVNWDIAQLKSTEVAILTEIEELKTQQWRAKLALRWVQGIINIKNGRNNNG